MGSVAVAYGVIVHRVADARLPTAIGEFRGIGIAHKLRAYELQDDGLDTVDANLHLGLPVDDRDYSIGAAILDDLGIARIVLLTNNPLKTSSLSAAGIVVTGRLPLVTDVHDDN